MGAFNFLRLFYVLLSIIRGGIVYAESHIKSGQSDTRSNHRIFRSICLRGMIPEQAAKKIISAALVAAAAILCAIIDSLIED